MNKEQGISNAERVKGKGGVKKMFNAQRSIFKVQGKNNATSCTLYATSREKGNKQWEEKLSSKDYYITKDALSLAGIWYLYFSSLQGFVFF